MAEKKKEKAAPPPSTEVIALPPLKMILVHGKDGRGNNTGLKLDVTPVSEQEHVKPQSLKKLIKHLENQPATKNVDEE
ncbi:MAG TPA: hypothetical protein PLF42_06380 [Anaerolineales bacterium]|nr:hypothetical protein [Anaerolineales bacterium]